MNECERREAQRYIMRIPLTFCPVTRGAAPPQRYGEIVDISPLGMCFLARNGAVVGETLRMFLKLPKDVMGKPSPEWCWTGGWSELRHLQIAISRSVCVLSGTMKPKNHPI